MAEEIAQSTTKRVPLKLFLSSDHISAATGKTLAVVISKNMGAFANPSAGATNATELSNGWYYVDLSTTDTNTTGPLVVRGTSASCDDAEQVFTVVNANNWGILALPNAAAEAAGGLYTRGTGAGQIAQDANGNIRANVDTIKTQAVTCAAGVTVLASVGTAATSTAQTGDCYARLGAPAGASVSADVAAVKSDTAGIKTKTDSLTFTVANKVDANALTVGDKTGYAIAAGGIDTTAITSACQNSLADAFLDRNMATGTDSGTDSTTTRTPRQAFRVLRNKASISAGTLTVTKENDTTASWTAAVSTTAGNPISAVDPT